MELNEKKILNDIRVVYVEALSFPDGINEAFDKLKSKVGHLQQVSYFGISNPEPGRGIVYRAAATAMPEVDAASLGLGTLTIKGGNHYSIQLENISKNISQISEAFQLILAQPGIDPNGCCIEIYDPSDADKVECIVRKIS